MLELSLVCTYLSIGRRRWWFGVLTAGYFVTSALAAFLLISKAALTGSAFTKSKTKKHKAFPSPKLIIRIECMHNEIFGLCSCWLTNYLHFQESYNEQTPCWRKYRTRAIYLLKYILSINLDQQIIVLHIAMLLKFK